MKIIILAAGYATRLFPLTENFPKHLITINKKTILDYLMEKLIPLNPEEIHLVTNNKYYQHFLDREKASNYSVTVHNDHTMSNEDRLGAIGDIYYTIEQGHIDEDICVVCADNLFEFDLTQSYTSFQKNHEPLIVAYDVKDLEIAKKLGNIECDENGKITNFTEKPQNPKSTLASSGIYFYPQKTISLIKKYLDEGNNKDAPGFFVSRLINNSDVYAHVHAENRYDVGTFEALKEAKEHYGETNVDIDELKKEG